MTPLFVVEFLFYSFFLFNTGYGLRLVEEYLKMKKLSEKQNANLQPRR
jgi:hypothetical protein